MRFTPWLALIAPLGLLFMSCDWSPDKAARVAAGSAALTALFTLATAVVAAVALFFAWKSSKAGQAAARAAQAQLVHSQRDSAHTKYIDLMKRHQHLPKRDFWECIDSFNQDRQDIPDLHQLACRLPSLYNDNLQQYVLLHESEVNRSSYFMEFYNYMTANGDAREHTKYEGPLRSSLRELSYYWDSLPILDSTDLDKMIADNDYTESRIIAEMLLANEYEVLFLWHAECIIWSKRKNKERRTHLGKTGLKTHAEWLAQRILKSKKPAEAGS